MNPPGVMTIFIGGVVQKLNHSQSTGCYFCRCFTHITHIMLEMVSTRIGSDRPRGVDSFKLKRGSVPITILGSRLYLNLAAGQ